MNNELTVHDPTSADLAPASAMIRQTAQDLADAHRIASALVATAFAPQHFRGKPEEGAAAILYGATIDMDPLTALQNLYVISGKPALYARAMVAVVMSKGHKVWTEHEAEGTVTVAGQRKGSSEVERVTWTSEMAKRAGYDSNRKYQSDPRSMLYARASGDVARRIAPDALLGMAHNVEELTIDPTAATDAGTPAPRATAAQFTAPATTSHPDAGPDDTPVVDAIADDPGDVMTARSRGEMFALFEQKGANTREKQLKAIKHYAGVDVDSRGDLTEQQALDVINGLRKLKDAQPDPTADPEHLTDEAFTAAAEGES